MAEQVPTTADTAKITARPPAGEVATTRDGRDITRGYVDSMPWLTPQDTVLQLRGAGDYRLYEEVRRDDQVQSVFEQRRLAVVSREWEVEPGDDSRKAKKAAEALQANLEAVGWDNITGKMLFGIFYGYAVGECLWARDGAQVVLDAVKVRKQRRFAWSPRGELKLLTSGNMNGEVVPPNKFWTFCVGADNDDEPYGLGLAHWLYWPVFFKRNGIKFWLIFLEKFGMPTAKGTYPSGAVENEKTKLLDALSAINTDAGVAIPEGMQIELLEAARSGTADYVGLHDRMNAAISKVIIGHTGSSDATPGRLGGEDNASDVREDIVKADADLVCESFNRTVARWLTFWNFGPDCPVPRVWRRVEPEEDLKSTAERDKTLSDIGYKPTLKRVREVYGEDYEPVQAPKPPVIPGAAPGATADEPGADPRETPPPAFAALSDNEDFADALTTQLEERSGAAMDDLIDRIKRVVETATTLEELRAALLVLYPQLDASALTEVLHQALVAANLGGRFEANDGS